MYQDCQNTQCLFLCVETNNVNMFKELLILFIYIYIYWFVQISLLLWIC